MLLTGLIAVSCADRRQKLDFETYQKAERDFAVLYASEDDVAAERALLDFRNRLIDWQQHGVTLLDYYHLIGLTDARLHILYAQRGDSARADKFFNSCTNYFIQGAIRRSAEVSLISAGEVQKAVAFADADIQPKWRAKHINGR